MLMLDNFNITTQNPIAAARASLVKALDMDALWQACTTLVPRALPCHSCSLMFDIDGYEPQRGRHFLVEAKDAPLPVTSLAIAAPYLATNPQVRWYTYSQIASGDALAAVRLRAQNPAPGWHEFIHLAFWNEQQLDAVLSIRIRADHPQLSNRELDFLRDLYPTLDASLQRVHSLESERTRHKALETLLHELPLATVVVDGRLTPLYLSAEARRICARWSSDGKCSGQRLPGAIERGIRQALHAPEVANVLSSFGEERSFVLTHPERGLRIRVKASPLPGLVTHYLLTFASDVALDALPASALPRLQRLSPRERKVAVLVARGLRNDEIAQRLSRSRRTIESQISSIYRKLGMTNRAQLARLLSG